ncbi:MAG TPA: RluA family pseudouridine synthase [Burkholderiaceae bacterium]|nr:RluA family pseudouridine synthase [Burkholderiaceae bacterium]HQR74787.1 RluA family pseudouridine synthase [Burkholderiaceae bacterium]
MDTARKTGKRRVPARTRLKSEGEGERGVAADRASHLRVDAEYAGQRLDNFLLRIARGVPKSHVYRIVRSGEVRVNKARVAVDYRLQAGDDIRIPPMRTARPGDLPAQAFAPAQMPPILFEDEYLIAVDKPSGVAAHGGSGVAHGVIERVRAARPRQAFLELAHRLDRETSGILLLAKSRRALLSLHEQLREGSIDKRYLVLVAGDWNDQRRHVRLALTKFVNHSGERRVAVDTEGAASHTIFNLRERYGAFSLLEAELKTGRTHQIRVHLAHLGFPIVGDDKYGDFELNRRVAKGEFGPRFGRMFLHAWTTQLAHPISGEPLALTAPLPPDCSDFLQALKAKTHGKSTV